MPAWLTAAVAVCVALQIAWQAHRGAPAPAQAQLPPPPSALALRAAAFGENEAAARLAVLYVQAFDSGGGNAIPYQRLDYGVLLAWLRSILGVDARSAYPLFLASRVYAENPDAAKTRAALEFVYQEYLRDPNRRWPSLAHAALLAKHRLRDLPLALRYAAAIDRYTTDPLVPLWAKQMQVFILADMNELEAAKIMLGGLIESGRVQDPAEMRFLLGKLRELEGRLAEKEKR